MTQLNIAAAGFAILLISAAPLRAQGVTPPALQDHILKLDRQVFEAYNACDLAGFSSHFLPGVEFYHDNGGATFDRKTVVANTRKYICGKVRRELLPASFKVYPIKDYGAVAEGEHRFCELASGACDGSAKFLIIWQHKKAKWQIARVVSYGHRTLTEAEKAALDMAK